MRWQALAVFVLSISLSGCSFFEPDSISTVEQSRAAIYVGNLRWPIARGNGRLSSCFGYRWMSLHAGMDIAAPQGTEIYAAHDGQVVYSGNGMSGYGNLIMVRGDGLTTLYAHNRINNVRVGHYVRQGEYIGEVGKTGNASGPHLHFETRVRDEDGKNVAVDPSVFYRQN